MVYVFLADGFEEVEALVPVDILRRAGCAVQTVGITGKMVTSSHQVIIAADKTPEEIDLSCADMIFLPGGILGTKNLFASDFVRNAVNRMIETDRYIAAICAAPATVLGRMGVLAGKHATCYPGMEPEMTGAVWQDMPCVQDGNMITGRGAGAVFDFAFTLCKILCGGETANQVAKSICYVQ